MGNGHSTPRTGGSARRAGGSTERAGGYTAGHGTRRSGRSTRGGYGEGRRGGGRITHAGVSTAAALSLVLSACGVIGADGTGDDGAPAAPTAELVVTEHQLPGEYDGEGRRTSQWHMLPGDGDGDGDGDLPALVLAVSQVMGQEEHPTVAVWRAQAGDMFGEPVQLEEAGTRVERAVLGGDLSIAVIAGYGTHERAAPEGTDADAAGDVAFLLTSTDRAAWHEVDLGEHAGFKPTAAGGSADLVVAVDSSGEESAQVVVVDDGQMVVRDLRPRDPQRRAHVAHAFVHEDRIILSGYEGAPGEVNIAAIWVSADRGASFTRADVDDEGAVRGVTRAGTRYFATEQERQGGWLRPRAWISPDAENWARFTMDYDRRDLGWQDRPENQGLSVPLGVDGQFYTALWSSRASRVQVLYHNRDERWSSTGFTDTLPEFGVAGLVAPDGDGSRTLVITAQQVRHEHWGEELTEETLATFTPGASVYSLLGMDEGVLVSTGRRVTEETDEEMIRYVEAASYADGEGDWLPEGLADQGAQAVATRDGTRVIVGGGGRQWDHIPVWRQAEPGAPWTRHRIEPNSPPRDTGEGGSPDGEGHGGSDTEGQSVGDIDAIFASHVLPSADQWLVIGDAGSSAAPEGRYGAIWASADGSDWHFEALLTGPDGTVTDLNHSCLWEGEPVVVGGYRHPDGGNRPGLWHRTGEQWHMIEVDEEWRGSLAYCRVADDVIQIGSGDDWWTTTDLATFTAGSDPDEEDDWSSPVVNFDEGWVYVAGTSAGPELRFSEGPGQWEAIPVDLDAEPTGGLAAVRTGDDLLIAEGDTGQAWRIENVSEVLAVHAAAGASDDSTEAGDD